MDSALTVARVVQPWWDRRLEGFPNYEHVDRTRFPTRGLGQETVYVGGGSANRFNSRDAHCGNLMLYLRSRSQNNAQTCPERNLGSFLLVAILLLKGNALGTQ